MMVKHKINNVNNDEGKMTVTWLFLLRQLKDKHTRYSDTGIVHLLRQDSLI